MAAIGHAFAEVNTNQTTTSGTFVDVPGAAIASGSFTAGKKYLLVVTAQLGINSTSDNCNVRVVHGSTEFDGSNFSWRPAASGQRWTYGWITVWTAVASEAVELEFSATGGLTAAVDFASLLAINLSDDVVENTDWFFADRATDDALGISFTDGASITFTPGAASHDWLVLAYTRINSPTVTVSGQSRIGRSGEASSSIPAIQRESATGTAALMARVFTLGAASNTFVEQAAESVNDTFSRLHSTVFAIDMNKFAAHVFAYTEAAAALSATNYATQLQTATIVPTVTGDVWYGGYYTFDIANVQRETEGRVQLAESDDPAGQTTANYQFDSGTDATDDSPWLLSGMTSLSASTAIDLDASADSATGTPNGMHSTIWAMSMELAAVAAMTPYQPWLQRGPVLAQ